MNRAILQTIVGVLGNILAFFLFLAPTITFQKILKKKSTEEFSGFPYPLTLLNCLISAWYALPFISEANILLAVINVIGAVIEAIYVLIFLIYATKKERAKILWLLIFVITTFSTVAIVSVSVLHGNIRRHFCGYAAAIFSVIMYISPLLIVRTVIRTKSVKYMPFFLSLFIFLSSSSWFIYGLLGNDPFVYVCNGFGCLSGVIQLILYVTYCKKNGSMGSSTMEIGQVNNGNDKHPQNEKTSAI